VAKYAVVDVANLFHRARHAVRGDSFTKAGMTLHIVFRSLRKLYVEQQCGHVVLALEGLSWRHSVYPAYKSRRRMNRETLTTTDKEEEEVFFQVLNEFAAYMAEKTRCTVLQSDGLEGDDLIARWIQLHPRDEHVILSGDSDFVQLLAPNVSIYNGMDDRLFTTRGVFDGKGQPLVFQVNPSDGKIKVGATLAETQKKHDKEEKEKAKRIEGYVPEPFAFTPEQDWWRKALFIKIIRGDTSDSVFAAYPGVRYEGSKNRIGIREAWEDRNSQGFSWNNFMLQQWDKLLSEDAEGNKQTTRVRVLDEYKTNEMLIDLTKQPQEIKDLMDTVIVQAVQKEPVGNVGMAFLQFCHRNELSALAKEATEHAVYLNRSYSA
jgi:5'-3' exonuclease